MVVQTSKQTPKPPQTPFQDVGNKEERWFAMLKLGEIYERFYRDQKQSEYWYGRCTEADPERADAWFYLGQIRRLAQDYEGAVQPLLMAASLVMPERALFQWHYLYVCLSKIEMGRALSYHSSPKRGDVVRGLELLKKVSGRSRQGRFFPLSSRIPSLFRSPFKFFLFSSHTLLVFVFLAFSFSLKF